MKKAILKIILAAAVAMSGLSSFAGNAAAEIGKGWTVSYAGVYTDRTQYYAGITEDANYSSGKSMYIKWFPSTAREDSYVDLTSGMLSPVTAGTEYELTFYLKGSVSSTTEIYIGERKIVFSEMTVSSRIDAADVPSGERNWKKCSYTLSDYTGNDATSLKFRIFSGANGVYVDDVSVVGADGENLITDSSFDGIEETVTEIEPFDTTDYQATRLMASSGTGMVGLSWKNPQTSDLAKVSIYNMTENTLVSDFVSITPSDVVVYPVGGLTDGKAYLFMIKFDFSNGATFRYYLSCAPGSGTYQGMLGAWNVWEYAGGTATYTPTEVSLDNTEARSGDTSMRFKLNIDTKDDPDLAGNNYIRVYQENLNIEANTKYEVRMWLKCEEMGTFNAMMDWSIFQTGVDGRTVKNFGGTISEWTEYTFQYDTTNGSVSSLNFLTETSGTMWMDDITLHKLDEDGNPTGDNLVSDGSFEGLLDTSVGELDSAVASDIGTNGFTLNWTATSSKINSVNIYEKLFDNWEYRGTVGANVHAVAVSGLDMGTEYSYKLVPLNSMGIEGTGVEVTAKTDMPAYTIKAPIMKKGGFAVTEISDAGTYTVTTEVKNYGDEPMEYLQCVAVYKDGALETIYRTECLGDDKIPVMTKNQSSKKVNTSFEIQAGAAYSAKVYIMDNILDMNSYIPKTVFE